MTNKKTKHLLLATLLAVLIIPSLGCTQRDPVLRIASNVWPGYEFVYLAKALNYFNDDDIRLISVPSATVAIQSLAAGTVDGAMLTLDEVLTANANGIKLNIVTVLDISLGADVLLAKPEITSLQQLRGKRIGVEDSAVGAIMLDAILTKSGLKLTDIHPVFITVNQHQRAYEENQVDALISFEPVISQLSQSGAHQLFSSADIPGRIMDVIAVSNTALEHNPRAIRSLVEAHFRAKEYYDKQTSSASEIISRRLHIPAKDVVQSYAGIIIPDKNENIAWLAGEQPKLQNSIDSLVKIMLNANLLPGRIDTTHLINADYIAQK